MSDHQKITDRIMAAVVVPKMSKRSIIVRHDCGSHWLIKPSSIFSDLSKCLKC